MYIFFLLVVFIHLYGLVNEPIVCEGVKFGVDHKTTFLLKWGAIYVYDGGSQFCEAFTYSCACAT